MWSLCSCSKPLIHDLSETTSSWWHWPAPPATLEAACLVLWTSVLPVGLCYLALSSPGHMLHSNTIADSITWESTGQNLPVKMEGKKKKSKSQESGTSHFSPVLHHCVFCHTEQWVCIFFASPSFCCHCISATLLCYPSHPSLVSVQLSLGFPSSVPALSLHSQAASLCYSWAAHLHFYLVHAAFGHLSLVRWSLFVHYDLLPCWLDFLPIAKDRSASRTLSLMILCCKPRHCVF